MLYRNQLFLFALIALFPVLLTGIAFAGPGAPGERPDPTFLHQTANGTWQRFVGTDAGLSLLDPDAPAPSTIEPPLGPVAGDLFGFPPTIHEVGSWPEAVAIGDLNGDGRNDVAMTTSFDFDAANDYHLFVFLQNEHGQLLSPTKYPTSGTYTNRPLTVDIGDVNDDGREDVVVGNMRQSIQVFLQNNAGTLEPPASYATNRSYKIRIADLNSDGLQDVVGLSWGTDDDLASVFLQNGGGSLDPPVHYTVGHGGYDDIAVGDVNHDGRTDAVVMSGQLYAYDNVGVLLQNDTGTLEPAAYYDLGGNQLSHGIAVGDVNGDQLQDVVITYGGNSPTGRVAVFAQNSSGTLDAAVNYPSFDVPEPVVVADVNRDGRQDVVVAHGGWYSVSVSLQDGAGMLLPYDLYWVPYASHYNPHGLAVGDLNGDGANDIVLADYNHGLVILYYVEVRQTFLPMATKE